MSYDYEKILEMTKEVLREKSKAMGLSEASKEKMIAYFTASFEEMKKQKQCPWGSGGLDRQAYTQAAIKTLRAQVPDVDKEVIEKVILATAKEMLQRKPPDIK